MPVTSKSKQSDSAAAKKTDPQTPEAAAHKTESAMTGVPRKGDLPVSREEKKDASFERVKTGVDRPLLITVLVLIAFGLVMVFSASYVYASGKYGDGMYFFKRQLVFAALGLPIMLVASRVPYYFFRKWSILIYLIAAGLLVAVLVFGVSEGSAQRWIAIAGITVQPSEIMKFAIVFLLAAYMSNRANLKKRVDWRKKDLWVDSVIPFGIVAVTAGMIIVEHHLSGTLIVAAIGVIVVVAGGASLKATAAFGGIGAVFLGAYIAFRGSYEQDRILVWLHPENYPRDGGWQNLQGLYAIGSGGFLGVGLGNSRLKYHYVSQPQNDFIFSIICEELGYVGALFVIVMMTILVWRGLRIAKRAPDRFSSLVALGITCQIGIQALLNIAVVTNSVPNTGVSLPFISYGGTSLLILMFEMGILLSISRHSYQKISAEGETEPEKGKNDESHTDGRRDRRPRESGNRNRGRDTQKES